MQIYDLTLVVQTGAIASFFRNKIKLSTAVLIFGSRLMVPLSIVECPTARCTNGSGVLSVVYSHLPLGAATNELLWPG